MQLCYQGISLNVVAFLEFFRRDISAGRVESLAVVPGNPFHGGEGDVPTPFHGPSRSMSSFL